MYAELLLKKPSEDMTVKENATEYAEIVYVNSSSSPPAAEKTS